MKTDCCFTRACLVQHSSSFCDAVILLASEDEPDYCLQSLPALPRSPRSARNATFDSIFYSQEVNRYLCSFICWGSASPGASTGCLSGLEGTLQARKRIRQRRSRRIATNVLQAMATSAAVDSPVLLPSDSITRTALQWPGSVVVFFHDISILCVNPWYHDQIFPQLNRIFQFSTAALPVLLVLLQF